MRAIAIVIALVAGTSRVDANGEALVVAVYWQPPHEVPAGAAARASFAEFVRPLGARLIEVTAPIVGSPPSQRASLEHARALYAHAAFAEALAALDELQRRTEAQGGADLDARQISDIFFYRWLCRSELGQADAAWEDLVRAAAIDASRVVDAALLPPRAVGAYQRALNALAQLPRITLKLEVPEGAILRLDGTPIANVVNLIIGQHLLRVEAAGYEPWAASISISPDRDRYAPPLSPYKAPDGDQLLTLVGPVPPRRVLLGAVERAASGWRFVVRELTLPEGKLVSESVALPQEAVVRPLVESVLRQLTATAPAPARPPPRRRWWIWGVIGGGAAVAAVAIALGVVYGAPAPSGSVSGALGLK